MGIMSWDLDGGFSSPPRVRTPRLTIRCEYPDTGMAPTQAIFGLSRGLLDLESNRKLNPNRDPLVTVQSRRKSEDVCDLESRFVKLQLT